MNNWTENFVEYLNDFGPLVECFLTIGLSEKDFRNYFNSGEILKAKVISQFPAENSCRLSIPETLSAVIFM